MAFHIFQNFQLMAEKVLQKAIPKIAAKENDTTQAITKRHSTTTDGTGTTGHAKEAINSNADAGRMEGFDYGAEPPFKIADVRAAIPAHCFVKNPWWSCYYVLRDVVVVLSLLAVAVHFDSWIIWPFYWFAQGTMFWALFVLGHDCGHGSFSDNTTLNNIMGHVLHSFILVPYHGWRISHRTHHQNHGHVENDESWVPLPETLFKKLDYSTKFLRYKVPFPMFAFPIYLWYRSPGKNGSHFNPSSDLFRENERRMVMTSTICWVAMVGFLFALSAVVGPFLVIKLYGVPYLVFVMWLDFVTYLHHHGHDQKLPWYRGKEWSYLRGGLTTVDRDYGLLNKTHHDIGTHVVHHLFPQIPHYHLVEATRTAKNVLGEYYREPQKSGPIPLHLIPEFVKSLHHDHFVSDAGDVVYHQTDTQLFSSDYTSKIE